MLVYLIKACRCVHFNTTAFYNPTCLWETIGKISHIYVLWDMSRLNRGSNPATSNASVDASRICSLANAHPGFYHHTSSDNSFSM